MRILAALSIFIDIREVFKIGFIPTLKDILRSPTLLFRWKKLSRVFMGNVWGVFGNGVDENAKAFKTKLLTPHAQGVLLDVGAGFGTSLKYLDRSKVTKYIALEPNKSMHDGIRTEALSHGYTESDGSMLILSTGVENVSSVISSIGVHSVDTMIFILTLCSIPSPEEVLKSLVRDILKPGGQVLFFEHVQSSREDVVWWQRFWAPLWSVIMDGCQLARPTHLWVQNMVQINQMGESVSMWREGKTWEDEDQPLTDDKLFPKLSGRFVKA